MKIAEVVTIISEFAPFELQEKYDNVGLQIGDSQRELTGVLLAIDVTEAVIEEAISMNFNLILVHHPLIFNGLKTITGNNLVERCVVKAISNNIAILVAHTNIDAVNEGVSYKMARMLGLINCSVLSPKRDALLKLVTFIPKDYVESVRNAVFEAGAGKIGNYSNCGFSTKGEGTFLASEECTPFVGKVNQLHTEAEVRFETIFPFYRKFNVIEALKKAHPYEEVAFDIIRLENSWESVGYGMVGDLSTPLNGLDLLAIVKDVFKLKFLKYTELPNRRIKRVALSGGSGSDFIKDAIRANADVYISADFKYHQFFDADNRLSIVDIGHYESEQFTKELFFEILTKKIPTFAVCKSSINTNPIKYL